MILSLHGELCSLPAELSHRSSRHLPRRRHRLYRRRRGAPLSSCLPSGRCPPPLRLGDQQTLLLLRNPLRHLALPHPQDDGAPSRLDGRALRASGLLGRYQDGSLLAILVPVIALFTLLNKGLGGDDRSSELPRSRRLLLSCLGGGFFGFYDGFFGPGTGSFLLVFYILGLKYDLVKANGNTKVVNLASNIAALATFLLHGKVVLALGVPALFFGIGGNLLGARLVVSRGSRVIRPIFLLGLTLLMVKVLSNLWRP